MNIKNSKYFKYSVICLAGLVLVLLLNRLIYFATPRIEKSPTPGPSEIALATAVSLYRNREISVVDLSTVTTFSWDRVFIFGPYTTRSKIDQTVGRSWRSSCNTTIEFDDGIALLVFMKRDRVVGCIEQHRNVDDFAPLETYEDGFSVQEARFEMDEQGAMVWLGNR